MKEKLKKMVEDVERTSDILVFIRAIHELENAVPRLRDHLDREELLYHIRSVKEIIKERFPFFLARIESTLNDVVQKKLR